MTMRRAAGRHAARAVHGLRALGAITLVCGMAACNVLDDALDVDAPAQVPAASLDDPQFANLLVSGAVADFECALGAFIVTGGLLGDELYDASFTANRWPVPSRTVAPNDSRYSTFGCENLGVYTPISTARWSADNALTKLQNWTDAEVQERQKKIATVAALSGYDHIMLGEMFCEVAIDLSAEMDPQAVFERGEARFTTAIEAAQAAGDQALLNLARVGRARIRLDMGDGAGAVADAQAVPQGFEYDATASVISDRRRNRIAQETRLGLISVTEPYRNLTVGGEPDTRVAVIDAGRTGVDAQTRLWQQTRYADDASPIPVATWEEAQLIIAEVQGGQAAIDAINRVRASHDLPAWDGSGDVATQVREERRREFFLEGHRLGDMRRFGVPFFPASGTPFSKGGQYGDATCLPLPDVERASNPNVSRS